MEIEQQPAVADEPAAGHMSITEDHVPAGALGCIPPGQI
jgi:hypothetical protein